jgi:hypothetical protein
VDKRIPPKQPARNSLRTGDDVVHPDSVTLIINQ